MADSVENSVKTKEQLEMTAYQDKNKPVAERVNDLVGRMTLKEKVAQLTGCMAISRAEVINQLMSISRTVSLMLGGRPNEFKRSG
jgi:hypothetical protein